mmetsp:Transcript_106608/g.270745  ORF Transcript_106608/g.270745 Transcript_106608/m.270745 type:complete len:260 (+) Transcript_106608:31-810(+)
MTRPRRLPQHGRRRRARRGSVNAAHPAHSAPASSHVHEVVAASCRCGARPSGHSAPLQGGGFPDVGLAGDHLPLEIGDPLGEAQDLLQSVLHLGHHGNVQVVEPLLEGDVARGLIYPRIDLAPGDHVEEQRLDFRIWAGLGEADLLGDLRHRQRQVGLREREELVPLQGRQDLLDKTGVVVDLDGGHLLVGNPLQCGGVSLLECLGKLHHVASILRELLNDVGGVDRQCLYLAMQLQRHQDVLLVRVGLDGAEARGRPG